MPNTEGMATKKNNKQQQQQKQSMRKYIYQQTPRKARPYRIK